jgi:uncharacterized membrane protein YkoI
MAARRAHGRLICDSYAAVRNSSKEAPMNRKLVSIAACILVLGAISASIAIAAGGGDEKPLTGSALEKATAAALARTGGGTVVETETGDDGAAYEVEVRLADGTEVEVSLDENFKVMDQATHDDGAADEQEGPDDDD